MSASGVVVARRSSRDGHHPAAKVGFQSRYRPDEATGRHVRLFPDKRQLPLPAPQPDLRPPAVDPRVFAPFPARAGCFRGSVSSFVQKTEDRLTGFVELIVLISPLLSRLCKLNYVALAGITLIILSFSDLRNFSAADRTLTFRPRSNCISFLSSFKRCLGFVMRRHSPVTCHTTPRGLYASSVRNVLSGIGLKHGNLAQEPRTIQFRMR